MQDWQKCLRLLPLARGSAPSTLAVGAAPLTPARALPLDPGRASRPAPRRGAAPLDPQKINQNYKEMIHYDVQTSPQGYQLPRIV